MFSSRHHIHLICDFSDVALRLLQDSLFVHFESKAYLTHDLFLMRPESSAYSWQCINACDYAFLLIGDSYGQLANTGVSQLHISYLNARTKQKPMVAFIKKRKEEITSTKESRQLNDFINLITVQVKDILYYDDESDFKTLINNAHQLVQNQNLGSSSLSDIVDENLPIYDITDDEPVLISKTELIGDEPVPMTVELLKLPDFDNMPSLKNTANPPPLAEIQVAPIPVTGKPRLVDMLSLNCNAHAFQDGTLIEVSFKIITNWKRVLVKLLALPAPFGTQALWKTLNDIATPQAMPAIKTDYPKVHAVSRCQVVRPDILAVQEALLNSGWIERMDTKKDIWQMTDAAYKLIEQSS